MCEMCAVDWCQIVATNDTDFLSPLPVNASVQRHQGPVEVNCPPGTLPRNVRVRGFSNACCFIANNLREGRGEAAGTSRVAIIITRTSSGAAILVRMLVTTWVQVMMLLVDMQMQVQRLQELADRRIGDTNIV